MSEVLKKISEKEFGDGIIFRVVTASKISETVYQ